MKREGMRPVTRRTRAYFAAVDRVTGSYAVFDPSRDSGFLLDAPPTPWIGLGWVEEFRRVSTSRIEGMSAGPAGAVTAQGRSGLGARIEFEFRDWGKLQMALAGGAEHMNVLASDPSASRAGSGGIALAAVPLLDGSSEGELVVGVGAVDAFEPGDIVACDVDYGQQSGYVGTGIPAAYVKDPQDVRQDANYIRRVTFNVARVAEKTATSLLLAQRLPGGIPATGAAVQKVKAFVDREGGAFLQQWSGLFVEEEESGGRVCYYYPRLSPSPSGQEWDRERRVEIEKPIRMLALRASFIALPTVDENDGAVVLCYRSYFPGEGAATY
jgi:hypothetical protein